MNDCLFGERASLVMIEC